MSEQCVRRALRFVVAFVAGCAAVSCTSPGADVPVSGEGVGRFAPSPVLPVVESSVGYCDGRHAAVPPPGFRPRLAPSAEELDETIRRADQQFGTDPAWLGVRWRADNNTLVIVTRGDAEALRRHIATSFESAFRVEFARGDYTLQELQDAIAHAEAVLEDDRFGPVATDIVRNRSLDPFRVSIQLRSPAEAPRLGPKYGLEPPFDRFCVERFGFPTAMGS